MNIFAIRLRPGETPSAAIARALPCSAAHHDGLAIDALPFVGVQQMGEDCDSLALVLANCTACGSTIARPLQALLHDDT